MKQALGWMFPDHEVHMIEWMKNPKGAMVLNGRPAYQGKKQQEAMALCRSFRRALDVGGHIGMWSFNLAKKFKYVNAFEPLADHRKCFHENVRDSNVELHPVALGEKNCVVKMQTKASSSGDSRVADDEPIEMTFKSFDNIPMLRLDDGKPPLDDVDFIKLDCEGYELFALRGMAETIKRCRPVICVEQKPGHGRAYGISDTAAIDFLQTLGYTLAKEISGDFIMVPS